MRLLIEQIDRCGNDRGISMRFNPNVRSDVFTEKFVKPLQQPESTACNEQFFFFRVQIKETVDCPQKLIIFIGQLAVKLKQKIDSMIAYQLCPCSGYHRKEHADFPYNFFLAQWLEQSRRIRVC